MTRGWDRKYFDEAVSIHFVLDASPYGLGGVAYIDGVPVAFFWSDLTEHDEHNTNINEATAVSAVLGVPRCTSGYPLLLEYLGISKELSS